MAWGEKSSREWGFKIDVGIQAEMEQHYPNRERNEWSKKKREGKRKPHEPEQCQYPLSTLLSIRRCDLIKFLILAIWKGDSGKVPPILLK